VGEGSVGVIEHATARNLPAPFQGWGNEGQQIMNRLQGIWNERRLGVPALAVVAMLLGAGARFGMVNAGLIGALRAGNASPESAVGPSDAAPRGLAAVSPASDTPAPVPVTDLPATAFPSIEGIGPTELLAGEPAGARGLFAPLIVPGSLVTMPDGRVTRFQRSAVIDGIGAPLPMPEPERDERLLDRNDDARATTGQSARESVWLLRRSAL
jgi:hypothetical protein